MMWWRETIVHEGVEVEMEEDEGERWKEES